MPAKKPISKPGRGFTKPRFDVQARGIQYQKEKPLPLPLIVGGELLNQEVSQVVRALEDLKLNFSVEVVLGGASELGASKVDIVLWDYNLAIEYQGPFHETTVGQEQDFLRRINREAAGLRTVYLSRVDLPRIHERILEIIGRRGGMPSLGVM
jgi:hypothetical protein